MRCKNCISFGIDAAAILAAVAILVALSFFISKAFAQEHGHPSKDAPMHEQFYNTWMMPDNRANSCCSLQDCFPTPIQKRGENWWALDRDGVTWVLIPPEKLEWDRDSPDGNSHACIHPTSGTLLCAIIGSGT